MRIKKLKARIHHSTQPPEHIKVSFDDIYIHKIFNPNAIQFPSQILTNYTIQYKETGIYFTLNLNSLNLIPIPIPIPNRIDSSSSASSLLPGLYDDEHMKLLVSYFEDLSAYHVRVEEFGDREQEICYLLDFGKVNQVLGWKKFCINEGRFERGDYLIYSRIHIKQLITITKNFLNNCPQLFQLDSVLETNSISTKHSEAITQIITNTFKKQIIKAGAELGLKIEEVQPRFIEDGQDLGRDRRPPRCSIFIKVTGNGRALHQMYLRMEEIICRVPMTTVQLPQQPLQPTLTSSSPPPSSIFPFPSSSSTQLHKLSPQAVFILGRTIDPDQLTQIKRKLMMRVWSIGQDEDFTVQDVRLLNVQYRRNCLKTYMQARGIFWENIQFGLGEVLLTCDRGMRNGFVSVARLLLKSFVKEEEVCEQFDTVFLVEIFKKYFQHTIQNQQQYHVKFQIHQNYIIRRNYNKHSQQIQQQLRLIREKIAKKIIIFPSQKSVHSLKALNSHSFSSDSSFSLISLIPPQINFNPKFFPEVHRPPGYERQLLGCCVYQMGNVRIKMKRLEGLIRREDTLIYIFDARLKNSSMLYKILQKNKINFSSFLQDANRTKKPDRLRQYITQDCPRAKKTILFHSGPEKVTNTLNRDIENVFSKLENRTCIVLLAHEDDFFRDVLFPVLSYIRNQAMSDKNLNSSVLNNKSWQYEVDFYYEGGEPELKKIESVLSNKQLQIKKLSSFSLTQFDLQKIYALQYCNLSLTIDTKKTPTSPLISFLLHHQTCIPIPLQSPPKTKQQKKFVFSIHPDPSPRYQVVQFLINIKTHTYFRITHNLPPARFPALYPHVEVVEELEPELEKFLLTITTYLNIQYIVISGSSLSDGIHSRSLRYNWQIYMAKYGCTILKPIMINMQEDKMYASLDRDQIEAHVSVNEEFDWYEVMGFQEEIDVRFWEAG